MPPWSPLAAGKAADSPRNSRERPSVGTASRKAPLLGLGTELCGCAPEDGRLMVDRLPKDRLLATDPAGTAAEWRDQLVDCAPVRKEMANADLLQRAPRAHVMAASGAKSSRWWIGRIDRCRRRAALGSRLRALQGPGRTGARHRPRRQVRRMAGTGGCGPWRASTDRLPRS